MAWIKIFRYFENLNVLLNKSINRKFPKYSILYQLMGKSLSPKLKNAVTTQETNC